MEKKDIADIFSAISNIYDKFLSAVTFGGIHAWQNTLISLSEKKGTLLDIGTGTGEVALKAKNKGYNQVIGIDISLEMLKIATEKCNNCIFILADAENLPFKEESIDTITLSLVYRHLLDRKAFLKEARRVLKNEGRICILDIGKIPATGLISSLMKTILKPLGIIIFGKERWDFFIHSIENSLSESEVEIEFKEHNLIIDKKEKRLGGLLMIMSAKKLKGEGG